MNHDAEKSRRRDSVRNPLRFPRGIIILLSCLALLSCSRARPNNLDPVAIRARLDAIPLEQEVHLRNDEWEAILSPAQFHVMRRAGTERPSQSGNVVEHRTGTYVCSACGNPLYGAATKFDSGTGWPSFWEPIKPEAIRSAGGGMSAIFGTEISCARCSSHLGHVFNDGPAPTGLRYCMNAVALSYRPSL